MVKMELLQKLISKMDIGLLMGKEQTKKQFLMLLPFPSAKMVFGLLIMKKRIKKLSEKTELPQKLKLKMDSGT